MKLIVGLGNPEPKYFKTRHNAGFIILDTYITQLELNWENVKAFNSHLAHTKTEIFQKPQTYMNLSGSVVRKVFDYYKATSLIVIHDDVDLEFGKVRVSTDSGAAGHNGVKSIIESFGTQNFTRIRFGVGRPVDNPFEVDRFVLSDFTPQQYHDILKFDLGTVLPS